jgi:signal transduction histidine kinase
VERRILTVEGNLLARSVWVRNYREALRHLGSDYALSNTVIASFALLFGAKTVLTEIIVLGGDPLQWLLLGTSSIAVSVSLCLLARRFLVGRCSDACRPWAVVGIYLLAGWSRTGVLLASTSTLSVPFHLGVLPAPMLASLAIMTLTAASIGRIRDHLAQMNRLLKIQAQLLDMNENFERRVAESNDDLHEQVRGYLDPAIVKVRELLNESDNLSADALSNSLAATISEVVRPLAQSLSRPPTSEVPLVREPATGPAFRLLSARVDAPRSIMGLSFMVIMVMMLSIQPIQLNVYASNPATIPVLLLGGLVLLAIKLLWPRRFAMFSIPVAGVFLIASFTVALLVPLWIASLVNPQVVLSAVPYLWVSLAYWLLLGMIASMPSIFIQLGQQDSQQTEASIAELELVEARYRRQLWLNRRNLTWVLHGPIQSALVSTALSLSGSQMTDEDRERVRVNLALVLSQLGSTSTAHPDLPTALTALAAVWNRNCTLIWEITPEAQALLDSDRDAVVCIGEVVREAVSNAVRHGKAGWIDIRVEEQRGILRVAVQDNGTGLSPAAIPGLGSAMFDEITHSWTRTAAAGHTSLEAWVPAAARAVPV